MARLQQKVVTRAKIALSIRPCGMKYFHEQLAAISEKPRTSAQPQETSSDEIDRFESLTLRPRAAAGSQYGGLFVAMSALAWTVSQAPSGVVAPLTPAVGALTQVLPHLLVSGIQQGILDIEVDGVGAESNGRRSGRGSQVINLDATRAEVRELLKNGQHLLALELLLALGECLYTATPDQMRENWVDFVALSEETLLAVCEHGVGCGSCLDSEVRSAALHLAELIGSESYGEFLMCLGVSSPTARHT